MPLERRARLTRQRPAVVTSAQGLQAAVSLPSAPLVQGPLHGPLAASGLSSQAFLTPIEKRLHLGRLLNPPRPSPLFTRPSRAWHTLNNGHSDQTPAVAAITGIVPPHTADKAGYEGFSEPAIFLRIARILNYFFLKAIFLLYFENEESYIQISLKTDSQGTCFP